jgi:hypothetical protein
MRLDDNTKKHIDDLADCMSRLGGYNNNSSGSGSTNGADFIVNNNGSDDSYYDEFDESDAEDECGIAIFLPKVFRRKQYGPEQFRTDMAPVSRME